MFKVVNIYSTGARFKCVRYAPVDHNKWVLTEELHKSVMKEDIVRSLSLRKVEDGSGVYTMDPEEMGRLHHGFGGGLQDGSSDEERDDEEGEENNEVDSDDDEVMVEPVFEDGISEAGDPLEIDEDMA